MADAREEPIRSFKNPRFLAALSLRGGQERRELGRILIDGPREIRRALDAGITPLEAWVDADRMAGRTPAEYPGWRADIQRLRGAGCRLIAADARLVERLSYGDRSMGMVLVAEMPRRALVDLDFDAEPLVGVVESVEKPGNLGAILRSADGAGVAALLVTDPATDVFNPNVIRASLGTVFTVPLATASTDQALAWLRSRELRIVTARVDAPTLYTEADLTGAVAIVLGSEAAGLGDAWSGPDVTAVRLPMLGVADSLNVSATAAILFYEALRQRRASGAP